jgi:hypothetical protein
MSEFITALSVKVVYNARHGGFGLSLKAAKALAARKGWEMVVDTSPSGWQTWHVKGDKHYRGPADLVQRHDPDLVAVVEELGDEANGDSAKLRIEEIRLGYSISNYDGMERVT